MLGWVSSESTKVDEELPASAIPAKSKVAFLTNSTLYFVVVWSASLATWATVVEVATPAIYSEPEPICREVNLRVA